MKPILYCLLIFLGFIHIAAAVKPITGVSLKFNIFNITPLIYFQVQQPIQAYVSEWNSWTFVG